MSRHKFRSSTAGEQDSEERVATYERVSTGRQMLNAVSVPSQREANTNYCADRHWRIVDDYVDKKTGKNDRRPQLQKMIERACSPDRPYTKLVGYSFNRFFRSAIDMEVAIRRLRKHGVELVSVTQPLNDDPSGELVRKIIAAVDEHSSEENGKNTSRAMRESAKQGFWNGATPPPGYKIVEAERRGQKMKKKLDVDPVEAENVRLIFRTYLEGDGETGPLGVKDTTAWLNNNGYRTRGGALFGVGTVHRILTTECYATGEYTYGRTPPPDDGRRREKLPPVKIPVPVIIEMAVYQRTQAKLGRNSPKVTPPRNINGPSLLAGIAVCASCGAGMTKTGTVRRDKSYSYYTCAGSHQKGSAACKGRHIPMGRLDSLVLGSLQEQLLTPERLASMLTALAERRTAQAEAVNGRLLSLQQEISNADDRLKRLYHSIEEGIVDLKDLGGRIAELKAKREQAQASLDRARERSGGSDIIDAVKIDAFAKLINEKLATGDVNVRRSYIGSVVDGIEVDDDVIRIVGRKDVLQAVIAGRNSEPGGVCGFVRKWRARRDSNS